MRGIVRGWQPSNRVPTDVLCHSRADRYAVGQASFDALSLRSSDVRRAGSRSPRPETPG